VKRDITFSSHRTTASRGHVAILVALVTLCAPLFAADAVSESELKATFLFNFTRFVEWPEQALPAAGEPLVIGVLGEDPFGGVLDAIVRDETVRGHPLAIKRMKRTDDITKCQILFIARSEERQLAAIFERLKGHSILTVSDMDRFAYAGGTIGLVMDGGKVRMQINVDRAKQAQLVLSAKLLRPALVIREQPQSMFPGDLRQLRGFSRQNASTALLLKRILQGG